MSSNGDKKKLERRTIPRSYSRKIPNFILHRYFGPNFREKRGEVNQLQCILHISSELKALLQRSFMRNWWRFLDPYISRSCGEVVYIFQQGYLGT